MSKTIIYTDGSSLGNPGPGGYAFIVIRNNGKLPFAEGYRYTTNNRMEILAAIRALQDTNKDEEVILHSDSKLLVDAINLKWIDSWSRNNWKKSNKKPVLNPDLWKELLNELKNRNVTFKWVEGHAGIPENEECDLLCKEAAENPKKIDEYYESLNPPSLFNSNIPERKILFEKIIKSKPNIILQKISEIDNTFITISNGSSKMNFDLEDAQKIAETIKEII